MHTASKIMIMKLKCRVEALVWANREGIAVLFIHDLTVYRNDKKFVKYLLPKSL